MEEWILLFEDWKKYLSLLKLGKLG